MKTWARALHPPTPWGLGSLTALPLTPKTAPRSLSSPETAPPLKLHLHSLQRQSPPRSPAHFLPPHLSSDPVGASSPLISLLVFFPVGNDTHLFLGRKLIFFLPYGHDSNEADSTLNRISDAWLQHGVRGDPGRANPRGHFFSAPVAHLVGLSRGCPGVKSLQDNEKS